MPLKFLKVIVFVFCLLNSYSFSQEDFSFEICEAITSQENPRIIQGLDNWLFSRTDLITDIAITDEALVRLKELKAAIDYRGIEIVFVLLPSRAMMHFDRFDLSQERFKNYDLEQAISSYENALEALRDVGFYAPNVYEYLLANADGKDYAFKRDSHWLPNSAALTAKLVKESLVGVPVLDALQFQEYEVALREIGLRDSDLARAVNIQCNLSIPPEPQEKYKLQTENSTQQNLFTESQTSLIPLWGTSYSQTSNFAEFLQAELNVDIVNYGYGAAGLWRSLRHYFLDKDLSTNYADLVIWEIPYAYFEEFNFLDIYQELIPTVYGACEGDLEIVPVVTKEINQLKVTTILSEAASKFEQPLWQPARASLEEYTRSEFENTTQLIFNGEKNPWLSHQVETDETLSNKFYEFSVWLWTDANQPKNAALALFSGKGNVTIQNITLTTEPKLYSVLHSFTETDKTSFTIRIDGLKKQWTANRKGNYFYAAEPIVRQIDSFELLNFEDVEDAFVLGNDYYNYIEFEDTLVREYDLVYNFADGSSQTQAIERDIYSDNNGKYFYELPASATVPLTSIDIDGLMSSAVGSVSTQICKKPEPDR